MEGGDRDGERESEPGAVGPAPVYAPAPPTPSPRGEFRFER
ncbi:MAG: hypothetical protein ACRDL6_01600 [Solirubrobacterales bacterium]